MRSPRLPRPGNCCRGCRRSHRASPASPRATCTGSASDAPLARADARPAGRAADLRRAVRRAGRGRAGRGHAAPRHGFALGLARRPTSRTTAACAVHRIERVVEYRLALKSGLLGGAQGAADRRSCAAVAALLHDRMTESVLRRSRRRARACSTNCRPQPMEHVDVLGRRPRARWTRPTRDFGLALADDEIDYLVEAFTRARPQPDRRRADDVRAGQQRALPPQDLQRRVHHRRRARRTQSLFADDPQHRTSCSRSTRSSPTRDNAAVMEGAQRRALAARAARPTRRATQRSDELTHVLMKVETHNHPTAISPFPGASTGAGGEIRDEGATGRGAQAEGRA